MAVLLLLLLLTVRCWCCRRHGSLTKVCLPRRDAARMHTDAPLGHTLRRSTAFVFLFFRALCCHAATVQEGPGGRQEGQGGGGRGVSACCTTGHGGSDGDPWSVTKGPRK